MSKPKIVTALSAMTLAPYQEWVVWTDANRKLNWRPLTSSESEHLGLSMLLKAAVKKKKKRKPASAKSRIKVGKQSWLASVVYALTHMTINLKAKGEEE